jgi:hypothetical protein
VDLAKFIIISIGKLKYELLDIVPETSLAALPEPS